ncbi:alpha/beta hydrolase [candidate division KSB1 bacterium]|nr:alpha/beta hydrolase [candidate division KSB1 bacterium]
MAASMYGINVLNLHIQIGQAAVDVLSQMPQVDPQRIACIGNSYGGRTAMWLTIFEDRIKACVPSGCMNTFRERSLKLSSCAIQYLPGVLRYGDVPELFGLIAPRPMQLQAGEGDGLITPEDRDQMRDFVRQVYDLVGEKNKFDYVLHPHGHSLQWSYAHDFLEKYL